MLRLRGWPPRERVAPRMLLENTPAFQRLPEFAVSPTVSTSFSEYMFSRPSAPRGPTRVVRPRRTVLTPGHVCRRGRPSSPAKRPRAFMSVLFTPSACFTPPVVLNAKCRTQNVRLLFQPPFNHTTSPIFCHTKTSTPKSESATSRRYVCRYKQEEGTRRGGGTNEVKRQSGR